MPILANSFVRCPFPVNFDPYGGCEHQCAYCFANRHIRKDARDKFDASKEKGESVEQLKAFCEGKRTSRLRWIDWKIPVCIGRNTDPFQPREAREKKTLACLKYLAKTGYPFIVTTKGVMMAEDREYREVLKDCNCVFQFSMCCPKPRCLPRRSSRNAPALTLTGTGRPVLSLATFPIAASNMARCVMSICDSTLSSSSFWSSGFPWMYLASVCRATLSFAAMVHMGANRRSSSIIVSSSCGPRTFSWRSFRWFPRRLLSPFDPFGLPPLLLPSAISRSSSGSSRATP